jgi:hypothetical protein
MLLKLADCQTRARAFYCCNRAGSRAPVRGDRLVFRPNKAGRRRGSCLRACPVSQPPVSIKLDVATQHTVSPSFPPPASTCLYHHHRPKLDHYRPCLYIHLKPQSQPPFRLPSYFCPRVAIYRYPASYNPTTFLSTHSKTFDGS